VEPVRIWLNRNYSTAVHLLEMLRENPSHRPVRLFGSHVDAAAPMLAACDQRLPEPSIDDPQFVEAMLSTCLRWNIDVLLPVAGQSMIAHRADEFRSIGTALICPPADAIDLLDDKAATYRALPGNALVPPWRVITSAAEFDRAVAELDGLWTQDHPLIVKPTSGVGADGVRFLTRTEPSLASLLGPVGPLVGISTFRRALADATDVPPLLVMPYLDGPETSVDVLASGGRTLAAVPRSKVGRQRVLGGDPELPGLAAEMVEHFGLDGLVNVQFRSFQGRPALLEINTRPSGGLYQTALAGVNLPWAAVQVALGERVAPLRPTTGAEFVLVPSVVPLVPARAISSVEPARRAAISADAA
jgi:hypothetical protein